MQNLKNNKVLLYSLGGVAVCVVVAALVYLALSNLAPKNTPDEPLPPSGNEQVDPPKDPEIVKAEQHYKAGDEALKNGDIKKGVDELKKALKIYEEKGDVVMTEQIKDQVAMAEFSLKAQEEFEASQPAPQETPQGMPEGSENGGEDGGDSLDGADKSTRE